MHSLRLSVSGGTSTGPQLRFAAATPRLVAAARGGRRASAVSAAPGMEPPRDDVHTTIEDVMSHPPFGVAYSTRSVEEGYGGVYAKDDDDRPAFDCPTAEAHPSHLPPGHETSQVKEEKHAT